MKRTDFTFRKAWMIYTVYFLLLFTPTLNAQQTSRLVSLELKKRKAICRTETDRKDGRQEYPFCL